MDHIVELQLIVDALNGLPEDTYTARDWQRKLVDFFNSSDNMRYLEPAENEAKGRAVGKLIHGKWLSRRDEQYIQFIGDKWDIIRDELRGFGQFKKQMDYILEDF